MPEEFNDFIGLKQTPQGDYVWLIYFVRKDKPLDSCGYHGTSQESIEKKCNLKSLDKFEKKPKSWEEIEPIKLAGVYYKHYAKV